MRLLEHEAKTLLREAGVAVPRGIVVASPDAAADFCRRLACPVALKAQILLGGRMKAGGVLFANTPSLAWRRASELLGTTVHGRPVEQLLVEERLAYQQELFVAVTYDPDAKGVLVLAAASGGIDVEATADHAVRRPFSVWWGFPEYAGRQVAGELGFHGRQLVAFGRIVHCLAQQFLQLDALLLEVNPLVLLADGSFVALDAHVEIDDDAIYRQAELRSRLGLGKARHESQTPFEQRAAEIDQADHRGVAGRVVAFDGDLGLLIGGGGASLTIFDALLDAGVRPANYCEIGGNPSVWKVKELTKLILNQPRVARIAVIMNIVSNTRADLVARGVIKGILELGATPSEKIAAFRVPGSWEDESRALLRHYNVEPLGRDVSIDQVVARIASYKGG